MPLRRKLAIHTAQICESYKKGMTLQDIASIHGCSQGTVRNLLVECQVPLRSRGRRPNKKVQKEVL